MLAGFVVLDGLRDLDSVHARTSEEIYVESIPNKLDHPDRFGPRLYVGHHSLSFRVLRNAFNLRCAARLRTKRKRPARNPRMPPWKAISAHARGSHSSRCWTIKPFWNRNVELMTFRTLNWVSVNV